MRFGFYLSNRSRGECDCLIRDGTPQWNEELRRGVELGDVPSVVRSGFCHLR